MARTSIKAQSDQLLESAVEQFRNLWRKCHGKFFDAIEESEQKKLKLSFGVDLNLSESEPVVAVDLCFKDKTTEGGLDVVKSFHAKQRDKLENPDAPALPGMERKRSTKPEPDPDED